MQRPPAGGDQTPRRTYARTAKRYKSENQNPISRKKKLIRFVAKTQNTKLNMHIPISQMAAVSKTQEAERYIGIGLGVEPSNEDKLGSVTLERGTGAMARSYY